MLLKTSHRFRHHSLTFIFSLLILYFFSLFRYNQTIYFCLSFFFFFSFSSHFQTFQHITNDLCKTHLHCCPYFKRLPKISWAQGQPKGKPDPKSVLTHSFYSFSETTPSSLESQPSLSARVWYVKQVRTQFIFST